jgi:hypothetical protein
LGVFLNDTVKKRGEILDSYTITESQIQLASTVMVPVWRRMMSSTAGGSRENYCVSENMCSTHLFLITL